MNKKATVLIVDDIPSNIQALAMSLNADYKIKVAKSGQRCLELAVSEEAPDIILLDVVMPEMDGYEVIKTLKADEKTKHIPVIFVTANDEDDEEEDGLKLGAVDYIVKPIRPAIAKARIETHITLKQQRDQLECIAIHDQLTGLYNRHYLLESASQKISYVMRHKTKLSFLILDIDHFKHINDKFGHIVGDQVLQKTSKRLQELCRTEDLVARLGGEEFVIILDQCGYKGAEIKAQEIRRAIEALEFSQIKVTISIGLVELNQTTPLEKGFESLLDYADQALYEAKNQGRNQVCTYQFN